MPSSTDDSTATVAEELDLLCSVIDDHLADYLAHVQAYLAQRTRAETLLNNGFLELAQTKFVLGPNRLTRFQYDGRMQAGTRINVYAEPYESISSIAASAAKVQETAAAASGGEADGDGNDAHVCRPDSVSYPTLVTRVNISQSKAAGDGGPSHLGATATSRRQRLNVLSSDADNAAEGEVPLGTVTSDPSATTPRDPIQWFGGLLAPASLRSAQKNFKQAVFELVELAKFRQELVAMEQTLRFLLWKKRQRAAKVLASGETSSPRLRHVSGGQT